MRRLTKDLFVSLPFNQVLERIQVEAVYFDIKVDYTPEWYSGICSYIDDESIGKKENGNYAGLRRLIQNRVKHSGLFQSRKGYIIHGNINGAANIGKKKHPNLFSKKMIACNLGLISDLRQPLDDEIKGEVFDFITTPPIKFSPSNGHPTKELKRKVGKKKVRSNHRKLSNESKK